MQTQVQILFLLLVFSLPKGAITESLFQQIYDVGVSTISSVSNFFFGGGTTRNKIPIEHNRPANAEINSRNPQTEKPNFVLLPFNNPKPENLLQTHSNPIQVYPNVLTSSNNDRDSSYSIHKFETVIPSFPLKENPVPVPGNPFTQGHKTKNELKLNTDTSLWMNGAPFGITSTEIPTDVTTTKYINVNFPFSMTSFPIKQFWAQYPYPTVNSKEEKSSSEKHNSADTVDISEFFSHYSNIKDEYFGFTPGSSQNLDKALEKLKEISFGTKEDLKDSQNNNKEKIYFPNSNENGLPIYDIDVR